MGGLINPIGDRLGRLGFWPSTYPMTYYASFKGSEVWGSVRLLINSWLIVVGDLYRDRSNSLYKTDTLLVGLTSNVWGFNADRLSIFLSLYDYRLADRALAAVPHRWFFKKFIRYMYQNSLMTRSSSIVLNEEGLESPYWSVNRRGRSLAWRIRRYVMRYFLFVREAIGRRLASWHRLLVVFLKPYLVRLANLYGFKRIILSTMLQRSSFTAGIIARYITIRLNQNASINFLIKQLRWGMLGVGLDKSCGYKVCFAGRFSRKQLATYRWVRVGAAGLNRLDSVVDYAYDYGFTRFGAYGFKLWIYHASR